MNQKEKNKIIEKYLEEKFEKINKEYPNFFDLNKLNATKNEYKNKTENIKDWISEIDKRIDIALNSKDKVIKEYYTNFYEDNRESRTFVEIKNAYNKLVDNLKKINIDVYVAGGSTIYLILNEDSNRLHDDIDAICNMNDMNIIRNYFKKTNYYVYEWDSLNYETKGIDYGLELKIDNVPVGIFPFVYSDNQIIQYSFEPYLKEGKTKEISNTKLENYISIYYDKKGFKIPAMRLEYIKKTKDQHAKRSKDMLDSNKIEKYGFDKKIYDELSMPIEVSKIKLGTKK